MPGLATLNSAGRKIQGVITGFNQLASNRDQTTYEVILESRLALLRNTPKCRFFLNLSFPKIIETRFWRHGFDAIQARFDFKLYHSTNSANSSCNGTRATLHSLRVCAGKDVNIATSAGFNLNAQRNATVAAAGALSFFAHNGGAKLFAARGKVLMQAQSDAMELVAQKDMASFEFSVGGLAGQGRA